jgi:tRNA A64-2'-O-ribosylphosphate transferase
VDTTTRGKIFPDSLSKTIPIWCAVLNRYVSDTLRYGWDTSFQSTASAVSETEIHQISLLIPKFVQKLVESGANTETILRCIVKPLRCIWIHPASRIFMNDRDCHWSADELDHLDFFPVICVSASIAKSVDHTPIFPPSVTFEYVQGAADDSESWAPGITAEHFWKISNEIDEDTSHNELQSMLESLVLQSTANLADVSDFDWIANTSIAIGSAKAAARPACWSNFDVIINCGVPGFTQDRESQYLYLDIPEGKKGQNELFQSITPFLTWIRPHLFEKQRILIHCMQGKDRSVGIGIALFQRFGKDLNPELPQIGKGF